jgi:hypothetical protein
MGLPWWDHCSYKKIKREIRVLSLSLSVCVCVCVCVCVVCGVSPSRLHMWGDRRCYSKEGRWLSTGTKHAGTLVLGFQPPELRHKCLLIKLPVDILLQQPKLTDVHILLEMFPITLKQLVFKKVKTWPSYQNRLNMHQRFYSVLLVARKLLGW